MSFFKKNIFQNLKRTLLGSDKTLKELLPEIEETLLTADVGTTTTAKLCDEISEKSQTSSREQIFNFLKTEIQKKLTPRSEFFIDTNKKPFVIYLVGVNGVGKTTTIGKLAGQFKEQGHKVLLIAADTFRAAAVEQLKIWAVKNQVDFVGGKPEADPSSVIVDGLRAAQAQHSDVVLIDTAGRLQTKHNLMEELKKMTRMCDKVLARTPDEIFLVVDAITGQNGFSQAAVFLSAIPLTGLILTKYDATAKGGIILSIVEQTGLPIRYVGLGEGIHDLKKFEAREFVEKLFG